MRDITFKQAKGIIVERLRREGWQVSDSLKYPHATSPLGGYRVWFLAQSIHGGRLGATLSSARSLGIDTKAMARYLDTLPAADDERQVLTPFLTGRIRF